MTRVLVGSQKLLTCSARDYVESVNKKLSDYTMYGAYNINVDNIAPGIEVIVDFRVESTSSSEGAIHYGTSLIPKKK